MPCACAALSTLMVPSTLMRVSNAGSATDLRTSIWAARCRITSGLVRPTTSLIASASRMSTCSRVAPLARASSRLSLFPVERSSTTVTWSPRSTSASTRFEPMNPAPPVTSAFMRRRILDGGVECLRVPDGALGVVAVARQLASHPGFVGDVEGRVDAQRPGRLEPEARVVLGVAEHGHEREVGERGPAHRLSDELHADSLPLVVRKDAHGGEDEDLVTTRIEHCAAEGDVADDGFALACDEAEVRDERAFGPQVVDQLGLDRARREGLGVDCADGIEVSRRLGPDVHGASPSHARVRVESVVVGLVAAAPPAPAATAAVVPAAVVAAASGVV